MLEPRRKLPSHGNYKKLLRGKDDAKTNEKVITLKLYSPLVIRQDPLDENGNPTDGNLETIGPDFDLLSCEEAIWESLERENKRLNPARGLMDFYYDSRSLPSVQEKVQSL